jgi:septal ring factor EnvC (AmiA/AmiB activator)
MQWWSIAIFVFIMYGGSMFAAAPAGKASTPSSMVEEKKRELQQLQQQLQNSQGQLQQHRHKEQSVVDRLDAISRRQATLAQDVYMMEQALRTAQDQADTLKTAHDRLSLQLDQQRQRLRQRVRRLYKLGQLPYMKLLLSAKDIAEFSRKVQYVQHLAARDREQLEVYHRQQGQLVKAQSDMAMAMQQLRDTQATLRDKREALAHERQQQVVLLHAVRKEKKLTEAAVGEFVQAAKTLTQLVARLQEQERRLPPRQVAVQGQLSWPLDGTVLSSYGRVRHPTLDVVTFQQGMYIGAPFGAEIRVAADGKVVYADWFKGLGRLLLVDHGNHIVTLYGHTSAIFVRVGEMVRNQQVVAKVGDSSALEEPALYFAVRHKTAPQDPLQWLRQRSVRLTERPEGRAGELR